MLECQHISQTKSKATPCGHVNPSDGLKYLTKTQTVIGSYSTPGTPAPDYSGMWTDECSINTSRIDSYDPATCAITSTCSGTEVCRQSIYSGGSVSYTISGTWTRNSNCTSSHSGDSCYCGTSSTTTTTYSSLATGETTADLISRTVAALPTWPTTWTGGCSSFRNLSPDESSYSLTRTKWRVAHSPSGTCYLKVWLQTRFTPEGGGTEIITPLPAYEWTATGNPCLPDTTKGPDHADNIIRSEESEEKEPADDGTTTVEIVKWSCIRGYTPPDDGTGNGFPVPA